jgi:hypothetical protein
MDYSEMLKREWDISISTKSNPEQLYVHIKKNSYNCLCFLLF